MKLTSRLLERYGYSEGCDGCRFGQAGLAEARPHSEQCRARVEEAMAQDEHGRRALAADEERVGHRRQRCGVSGGASGRFAGEFSLGRRRTHGRKTGSSGT